MGYLLRAAAPDLGRGVTPLVAAPDLGPWVSPLSRPPDLGRGVTPLGRRPLGMGSSWLLPLTSDVGWLLSAVLSAPVAAACALARLSQPPALSRKSEIPKEHFMQR